MSKSNKGKYFFIGALLGLIAGLLFAPKKGSELRRDVKDKVDDIKEDPKEVIGGMLVNAKEKISSIVEDIESNDINIVEDEIIISRSFDDKGDIE